MVGLNKGLGPMNLGFITPLTYTFKLEIRPKYEDEFLKLGGVFILVWGLMRFGGKVMP